eukprot:TRINITY_DN24518_c0_g1_i1.p1 TRINITY_DN24518_c0_g1~~TRINITY_DN24518_c0_g1_i1.p1  ORF type:complete len:273 (+),score=62.67 TRINITY_DN24518_c0_g1_i1:18-836(+)
MMKREHKVIPEKDGVKGIEIGDWVIKTKKKPIANSSELESLENELQLPSLPEMVFSNSLVEFVHTKSGFTISLSAKEGLREWHYKTGGIKVAYAAQWSRQKSSEAKNMAENIDWTFTTYYSGTLSSSSTNEEENTEFGKALTTTEKIDLDKLRIPEPILFFEELVLFHDELADNGDSMLTAKIRVMPSGFYCLMQFWLRVDDVLFKNHDTRFYHAFGTDYVLREKQLREDNYETLKSNGKLPSDPSKLAQANLIVPLLTIINTTSEKISLKK